MFESSNNGVVMVLTGQCGVNGVVMVLTGQCGVSLGTDDEQCYQYLGEAGVIT